MGKILRVIGAIVVSLFMYCTPVITTIAALRHWDSFWQWLLFIASSGELVTLISLVYYFASGSEDK